jgi:predicted dehydrogenase
MTGNFGRPTSPVTSPNLFAVGLGGGALLHRGIYPLSLATHLMGPPDLVLSQAALRDGVDRESAVLARHPNGGLSVSTASLLTQGSNDLVIQGTSGTIHIHAPIYRPHRMTLTRVAPSDGYAAAAARLERLREGSLLHGAQQRLGGLRARVSRERRPLRAFYAGNGYHYEADEVARCVRSGRTESAVMPLGESLDIAEAMAQARRQWAL